MEAFRGQFITGMVDELPKGFDECRINGISPIFHHPDLPVGVFNDGSNVSILIGLVFDSAFPDRDINEIIAGVASKSVDETVTQTGRLAGRWVMILHRPGQQFIFGDACGTMPITYSDNTLASSAKLIAQCVNGLTPDPRFSDQRFLRQAESSHSGQCFPGRLSEYLETRILLPNHMLEWKTGDVNRFYPRERRPEMSVGEAAPKIAAVLQGIMEAASRSTLAMGVTAGYDSRALIAALPVPETVDFFTFTDAYGCPPSHFDVRTAGEVVGVVRGRHRVIEGDIAGEPALSDAMTAPRLEGWAAACDRELRGKTVLSGWCSEVGRAFIRWPGSEQVTATQIANCNGYRGTELEEHEAWYSDALVVRQKTQTNILDLFYWELRSRWIGSGFNILNAGCDWVSVYSCRDLLDLMLSVPEVDRGGKEQRLYRAIIRELNPALLNIPFNPESIFTRFRKASYWKARRVLGSISRFLGVYSWLKRLRS